MRDKIRDFLYGFAVTKFICEKRKKFLIWQKYAWPYVRQRILNPDAVFLIMTPEYNNIGDHAIALAETKMLNELGIKYIEISGKMLLFLKENSCLNIFHKRTIIFNGGGYLGTLWVNAEELFRKIIADNPKSKIVMLPNTIYYGESKKDSEYLKESTKIYNAHNHLVIYAREKFSYEFMKPLYKDVRLIPDVVISLDYSDNQKERSGCLLCLRSDHEKTMQDDMLNSILIQVKDMFGSNFKYTDMLVDQMVSIKDRELNIHKKIDEFKGAELVITDRLHAMIFCAITETPCIVVNSLSPKVKGCYEWIKNLSYITFMDDVDNLKDIYNEIKNSTCEFDNSHLSPYYNMLKDDLIKICK